MKNLNFVNFRVRPGDDTSCLNLYQPRNPKIVAPPDSFIRDNRFTFQNSLASTAEQNNPWLLLDRQLEDGAVPVIGDANSLTYVLHLKVGDEMTVDGANGPLKLRIVAALSDSIFQSELLMSEKNFLRLFPSEEGYRMFLVDVPNSNKPLQSRQFSKSASQTSALTQSRQKNGSQTFIASKTHTSRRFRCSADSVSHSARSEWPQSCCATSSNDGKN